MEGAETKMNGQFVSSVSNSTSIAKWDISVNAENVQYSQNATEAMKKTKDFHTTVRTVFFKRGRHIFNIKIKHIGHAGIGIVGPSHPLYESGQWIGKSKHSYGTFNNIAAYHGGSQLKNNLKKDIKIKKGDIVKVDLDLYDRTFVWEINGERVTNDVKIAFDGPVAIAAMIYHPGDTVQIVQYMNQ